MVKDMSCISWCGTCFCLAIWHAMILFKDITSKFCFVFFFLKISQATRIWQNFACLSALNSYCWKIPNWFNLALWVHRIVSLRKSVEPRVGKWATGFVIAAPLPKCIMAFLCRWDLDLCSNQKVKKLWGFLYFTKGFYLIIRLYLKYNFASDRKKSETWLYFGSCQSYKLVMISCLSQNSKPNSNIALGSVIYL